MKNPFAHKTVLNDPEFQRIFNLPVNSMTDDEAEKLATELTLALKRDRGTMKLRPIQARALHAIAIQGGGFLPIRVGGGKTLTTLMAPYVLDAQRPILVLPAHLIDKTRREFAQLGQHWLSPDNLRIVSYQALGREKSAQLLEHHRPDCLIFDEAHKIKNKKAAVTRRIMRWMKAEPTTKVVIASGTVMKNSIRDFAHLIDWALKEGSPVPRAYETIEDWADCLDEKLANPLRRCAPGPLLQFAKPEDYDRSLDNPDTVAARRGFRRRLVSTPGIVATANEQVDCKLSVNFIEIPSDDESEEAFKQLRSEWKGPDGFEMSQPTEIWRVANQIALGIYYIRVDKDKYVKWQASTHRKGLSGVNNKHVPDITQTSKRQERNVEPTNENALLGTLEKSGLTSSKLATVSPQNNMRRSSNSKTEDVIAAEEKGKQNAFPSTIATKQEKLEVSSVLPATERSEILAIRSMGFSEQLSTFLEDGRPPMEWRMARSAWAKFAREILSDSKHLDSELQVKRAVRAGDIDDAGALTRWEAIEPTCEVETIAVWHSDVVLQLVAKWMKEAPGLVWCRHRWLAFELSKITGAAYFGAKGEDLRGRPVDDPERTNPQTDPLGIILSIDANKEGRNLQVWSRNLVTQPSGDPVFWEQLLGRTHRDGQLAKLVTVDVLLACAEHYRAWCTALASAQATQDLTGLSQKLLVCDILNPPDEEDMLSRTEWRWGKQVSEDDGELATKFGLKDF